MARESNVVPFRPRETPDPHVWVNTLLRRVYPEELFAYPHDSWFLEKIIERIRDGRSS
ncbi:hypothetical protein K2X83_00510 [Patescibacteria group bacterium]|nr:hypothetical protein [Patescibacteria group bacterium]